MITICEGTLVVVTSPGSSITFTTDQLGPAEVYGETVNFGLKMLRRQARHQGKHAPRAKWYGLRGREREGS